MMRMAGWEDKGWVIRTVPACSTTSEHQSIVKAEAGLPLPWCVEFHEHGFVLFCQVVEICVAELKHVLVAAARPGKRGQQDRDGGQEADDGRHLARKPPTAFNRPNANVSRIVEARGRDTASVNVRKEATPSGGAFQNNGSFRVAIQPMSLNGPE